MIRPGTLRHNFNALGMLMLAPVLSISLQAQTPVTANWLGTSGSWCDSTQWSTGTVPDNNSSSTYSVVIAPSGSSAVSTCTSHTVSSLDLNAQTTLSIGSSSLNVVNSVSNNGSISTGMATVNTGSLTNTGTVHLADSSMTTHGAMSNSGSISVTNGLLSVTGDLNNSGSVSYTGPPVSGSIGGNVNNSGDLTVGSYASLSAGGAIGNSGAVSLGWGATLRGTSYSQSASAYWYEDLTSSLISSAPLGAIDVTGAMNLGGTLDFDVFNNAVLSLGQTFTIANFAPGQLTGQFSTLLDNSFDNGTLMFDVNYDNADGRINLIVDKQQPPAAPEPSTLTLFVIGISVTVLAARLKRHVDVVKVFPFLH